MALARCLINILTNLRASPSDLRSRSSFALESIISMAMRSWAASKFCHRPFIWRFSITRISFRFEISIIVRTGTKNILGQDIMGHKWLLLV
ncbi:hypothetical protein PFISCL1PPCAC_4502, partial [Pristionchus fissidentatus]